MTPEFLAALKVILDLYHQVRDVRHPLVCFDEKSVQLLSDSRPEHLAAVGRPRRRDYEYVRHGTRNIFLFVEPHTGQRHTLVTRRRTKLEFSYAMRYLADTLYSEAEWIDVILDNLNTHTAEVLIEIFGKPEADRLLARLRFHYTPLHASWLNLAESEFAAMTSQCLDRRLGSEWDLATELIAWELPRNRSAVKIEWSLKWKRAKRLFAHTSECSTEKKPDKTL